MHFLVIQQNQSCRCKFHDVLIEVFKRNKFKISTEYFGSIWLANVKDASVCFEIKYFPRYLSISNAVQEIVGNLNNFYAKDANNMMER